MIKECKYNKKCERQRIFEEKFPDCLTIYPEIIPKTTKEALKMRGRKVCSDYMPFANSLGQICFDLNAPPEIKKTAEEILRAARQRRLTGGKKREDLIAASIYLACRKHRFVTTVNIVCAYSPFARIRTVNRYYKLLRHELNIKMPPFTPIELISLFCQELNNELNKKEIESIKNKAIEIVRRTTDMMDGMAFGTSGSAVASGAICLAAFLCKVKLAQRLIADVSGVAEKTVRDNYRHLLKFLTEEELRTFPSFSEG